MAQYSVLYDGWDLVCRPNSPAALHILGLLGAQIPGRQSRVTLPGKSVHRLPEGVIVDLQPASNTERARLNWEQRRIPALARRHNVDLVHWFDGGPALFGAARSVISPVGYLPWWLENAPPPAHPDFSGRLRSALSQGGLTRAHALLWPADLAPPQPPPTAILLPPLGMQEQISFDSKLDDVEISLPGDRDMPESYILYHGPTTQNELYHLFDAWRWASGAIGEYYPLLVIGIPILEIPAMENWVEKLGFGRTVGLVPPLSVKALAALYRGCSAIFHPTHISPWSIPLRLGLAYARPIVAQETPWSDAIVGPAAYLIASNDDGYDDSRALGAALTTVIVEESLADELSRAARQQTAKWEGAAFADELDRAYRKVLGV